MSDENKNTQNEESIDLTELAAAHAERDALRRVAVDSAIQSAIARTGFESSKSATATISARVKWDAASGSVVSHDGTKSLDAVVKDILDEASSFLKVGQPQTKEPLVAKGKVILSRDDFGNDDKAKSDFITRYGFAAWQALRQHADTTSGVIEFKSDLKTPNAKADYITKNGYAKFEALQLRRS